MSRSLGTLTLDLIAKIGGFTKPLDQAARNARKNSQDINKSSASIGSALKNIVGIAAAAFSVGKVTQYADEWKDLDSRVTAATNSHNDASIVMSRLFDISRNTYSAFSQTGEIYLKNSITLDELGYSTEKQLNLTSALNNALVAGATKGQAAESVVNALSKAMAEGQLRGQNFNTVIGSGGRVAKALADGLGVTTLELRKMAADGLLTSSKVVDALTSQMTVLEDEAAAMPATMSDGFLLINNSVRKFVGVIDDATDSSSWFSDKLVGVADGIADVANEIDAMAQSGQLDAYFAAYTEQFDVFGQDVAALLNSISGLFGDAATQWGGQGESVGQFLIGAFVHLPKNIRAYVQVVTVELAALVDKAVAYGKAIASSLDPRTWFDDKDSGLEAQIAAINSARDSSLMHIFEERDAALASYKAQIEKGKELRFEWEKIPRVLENNGKAAAVAAEQFGDLFNNFTLLQKMDGELNRLFNTDLFAFDEQVKKAQKTTKEVESAYTGMWERIAASGSSVFMSLMDGSDNVFEGIVGSFKTMLAEMANEALLQPIMLNIQQQFSAAGAATTGDGGSGSGAGALVGAGGIYAAAAVAVVAAVGSWNKKQDEKFLKMTAEYRQGTQSTGTLLGMANAKSDSIANLLDGMSGQYDDVLSVNYSMYRALIDIRAGIAGAAAGFARTGIANNNIDVRTGTWAVNKRANEMPITGDILNAVEGTLLPIGSFVASFMGGLADSINKEVFKKKVKVTDTGIQILGNGLADILAGGLIDAFAYADVNTKKKFLGVTTSNKMRTETEALDDIFIQQFSDVFASAGGALKNAADVYGINFDDYLSKLVINPLKVSLKDLEGDALTKEIEHFFSSTMDGWAKVLLSGSGMLEKFQQVGEGAFETMVRLANETNHFTQMLSSVGLTLAATGVAAVEAVQNIAGFAGGFDALNASMATYYDKFFTDAEKFDVLTEQLTAATGGLLDTLPTTVTEFRNLIGALDLTTEADQKTYAALINLSGPIAQYIEGLEAQKKALEDSAAAAAEQARLAEEARVAALSDLLKPFADNVAAYGLDAFELGLRDITIALEEAISAAQELGASEQQLSIIRRSADIDLQALLVSQTDVAFGRLKDAYSAQSASLTEDYNSRVAAVRGEFDTRINSLDSRLERELSNYQRRTELLRDSVKELGALSNALGAAIDSLAGSSVLDQQTNYAAASTELARLSASVKSGGALPTAAVIDELAAALQGGDRFFQNYADYVVATAGLTATFDGMRGAADRQLSIEEKMLVSMERSELEARENHKRLMSRMQGDLNAQLKSMELQHQSNLDALAAEQKQFEDEINALRGIDTSVLSVEQAVEAMRIALENEQRQLAKLQSDERLQMGTQLEAIARHGADTADEVNRLRLFMEGAA